MVQFISLKKLIISCCDNDDFQDFKILCQELKEFHESGEVQRVIEEDLPVLLPRFLLLSCCEDTAVRHAVIPFLDQFKEIVLKKPSLKATNWWAQLESTVIPKFCEKIVTLLEAEVEDWGEPWCFAVFLMCNGDYIGASCMNILLKVIERGFKLAKRKEWMITTVFNSWKKFIDVFAEHSRVLHTQKILGLLITPLMSNLPGSATSQILQTWVHLLEKIGFHSSIAAEATIIPFTKYMYLKNENSACKSYPNECCDALILLINSNHSFTPKCGSSVLSCLIPCLNSGPDDEKFEKLWTALCGQVGGVNWKNCISHLLTTLKRCFEKNKTELSLKVLQISHDQRIFNLENLQPVIEENEHVSVIWLDLLENSSFRELILVPFLIELNGVLRDEDIDQSKVTNALTVWTITNDVFALWIKKSFDSGKQGISINLSDMKAVSLFITIPLGLVHQKWSGNVQRKWVTFVDAVHRQVIYDGLFTELVSQVHEGVKSGKIDAMVALDTCAHFFSLDKTCIESMLNVLDLVAHNLPQKNPKPVMELLLLLENAIGSGPKAVFLQILSDLSKLCSSYDQPYQHRIRTRVSKLLRKVNQKPTKDDTKSKEEEKAPSAVRTPLISHSKFLQRLAKVEKKVPFKRSEFSNLFGINKDPSTKDVGESDSKPGEQKFPGSDLNESLVVSLKEKPIENKCTSESVVEEAEVGMKSSMEAVSSPPVNRTEQEIVDKSDSKLSPLEPVTDLSSSTIESPEEVKKDDSVKSANTIEVPSHKYTDASDEPTLGGTFTSPQVKDASAEPTLGGTFSSPKVKDASMKKNVIKKLSTKAAPKKNTSSPSTQKFNFFDDSCDAQDFVIIPPKSKKLLLTEHQKEVLSSRRADIPALYQDLSQDTQTFENSSSVDCSNSQKDFEKKKIEDQTENAVDESEKVNDILQNSANENEVPSEKLTNLDDSLETSVSEDMPFRDSCKASEINSMNASKSESKRFGRRRSIRRSSSDISLDSVDIKLILNGKTSLDDGNNPEFENFITSESRNESLPDDKNTDSTVIDEKENTDLNADTPGDNKESDETQDIFMSDQKKSGVSKGVIRKNKVMPDVNSSPKRLRSRLSLSKKVDSPRSQASNDNSKEKLKPGRKKRLSTSDENSLKRARRSYTKKMKVEASKDDCESFKVSPDLLQTESSQSNESCTPTTTKEKQKVHQDTPFPRFFKSDDLIADVGKEAPCVETKEPDVKTDISVTEVSPSPCTPTGNVRKSRRVSKRKLSDSFAERAQSKRIMNGGTRSPTSEDTSESGKNDAPVKVPRKRGRKSRLFDSPPKKSNSNLEQWLLKPEKSALNEVTKTIEVSNAPSESILEETLVIKKEGTPEKESCLDNSDEIIFSSQEITPRKYNQSESKITQPTENKTVEEGNQEQEVVREIEESQIQENKSEPLAGVGDAPENEPGGDGSITEIPSVKDEVPVSQSDPLPNEPVAGGSKEEEEGEKEPEGSPTDEVEVDKGCDSPESNFNSWWQESDRRFEIVEEVRRSRKGKPSRLKVFNGSPRSGTRSAHMIKLAKAGSPTVARPNITPSQPHGQANNVSSMEKSCKPSHKRYNYNAWPKGHCENWAGNVPISPSKSFEQRGILKRMAVPTSPGTINSPSPPAKKKRVYFSDPVTSTGLQYEGSCRGQLHYATPSPKTHPLESEVEKKTENRALEQLSKVLQEGDIVGNELNTEMQTEEITALTEEPPNKHHHDKDDSTSSEESVDQTQLATVKMEVDPEPSPDTALFPRLQQNSQALDCLNRFLPDELGEHVKTIIKEFNVNSVGELCSLNRSVMETIDIPGCDIQTILNALELFEREFQKTEENSKSSEIAVESMAQGSSEYTEPVTLINVKQLEKPEKEFCDAVTQFEENEEMHIPSNKYLASLVNNDKFIRNLAAFADYRFISNLCAAIEDVKKCKES